MNNTDTKKPRVATYCRVGTRGHAGKEALDLQEAGLVAWAEEQGYEVAAKVREPIRGLWIASLRHRLWRLFGKKPQFLGTFRLHSLARRGMIDGVATKSISRISRDTCNLLTFSKKLDEHGVFIHTAKEDIKTPIHFPWQNLF